ncbi:MAG TPA: hybrid sensor histidine kinase/response regulator, partial [Helicobacter sp.]|nr:hybrid sensor histidine kinase/response regulator [Helicobacter sp.]
MDDIQEIMEDFLVEAFEMIERLDQDLVELESNPEDLDLLNRIFRVAHTIKGSSSFLNFDILTRLTHNMEDVLNKARRDELKITPDVMDVVLHSIDLMKSLLNAIRDNGTDANSGIDIDDTVVRLQAISNGGAASEAEATAAAPAPEDQAVAAPSNNTNANNPLADEPDLDYAHMSGEEVEAEIERLLKKRQEADKQARAAQKANGGAAAVQTPKAPDAAPAPKPTPKPAAKKAGDEKAPAANVEQTVRVDVKRLDHLMNLIGELVLGKNRLIKIYGDVEERYDGEKFLEELNQVVASISSVTTDVQLAVMKTRMQPVGKVFNKFPRMVRDLSRELNKNIDLIISGEETELDKSIVEEIGDPLVHIIRNSCDHGVESPEIRAAAGKPETGTVKLKAYNEGNHIVIEIADDGKGLDADMLKHKAMEKGLISEREADSMSDKEAFALIFKPGFSTAAAITNVSGRGVGMDVVKTNIEK